PPQSERASPSRDTPTSASKAAEEVPAINHQIKWPGNVLEMNFAPWNLAGSERGAARGTAEIGDRRFPIKQEETTCGAKRERFQRFELSASRRRANFCTAIVKTGDEEMAMTKIEMWVGAEGLVVKYGT